jgi:hypothetical protein
MPKPCPCRTGVSSLRPEAGGTNSGCHGDTAGVSVHQKRIMTGPKIVLVLWNDFFVNTQGAASSAARTMASASHRGARPGLIDQ